MHYVESEHHHWVLLNDGDQERVFELEDTSEVLPEVWKCYRCFNSSSKPDDGLMTLSEVQHHVSER